MTLTPKQRADFASDAMRPIVTDAAIAQVLSITPPQIAALLADLISVGIMDAYMMGRENGFKAGEDYGRLQSLEL